MSDGPPTRNPKRQRQKEGAQARRAAQVAALRRRQRNRRIVRIGVVAVVALAFVLLIGGLGGDGDDDTATTDTTEVTDTTEALDVTTTTVVPLPATPLECGPPTGENTDLESKPSVPVPDEAATELSCVDLVVGEGDEVLNLNDTVEVQYVGVSQSTGEEFDSSWDRGQTASFSLQGVISGWTAGIPGMKVGGRRVLVIPADMAYGDEGDPSGTLVFVVDLIAVNPQT